MKVEDSIFEIETHLKFLCGTKEMSNTEFLEQNFIVFHTRGSKSMKILHVSITLSVFKERYILRASESPIEGSTFQLLPEPPLAF